MSKKRMKLYDKKTFSKVNENNKMLLQDYMAELTLTGKSPATCYQYKADIRAFLCWLVKYYHNADITTVRKRVYRMFLLQMVKCESHNRINRVESSIRNLLEFARRSDDYDLTTNPMADIKGMKKQLVRKIIFVRDKDITRMLKYLLKHHKYQIATYLSLSYDSAGRRREVLQVTRKSVEDAIKNHTNFTNKLRGKEDKHFALLMFPRTKKIAAKWLNQRGDDNVKSLWRTKENGHYKAASYQTLYYWVEYLRTVLYKVTGVKAKINCHSFRHSCLENMNNGSFYYLKKIGKKKVPLTILENVAHHSSLDMTKSYLNPDDDKKKIVNEFGL